nr:copper-translocating P-type ATPase [Salinibacter sp. 10B]
MNDNQGSPTTTASEHASGHEHGHSAHDEHSRHEHEGHGDHEGHHDHHAQMVEDFRRRFWISLILTVPILLLSPLIQSVLGIEEALQFPGDLVALWGFSSVVFVYGGWPFLKGIYEELSDLTPGMMTLIAVAITVAYVYSSAVVFGLTGSIFFWELATLIDVMLVGHWIEMRSVMGASKALEELAKLMPQTAHRLTESGDTEEVPLEALQHGDRVLIRPGEKIPADGEVVEGSSSVNEAMLTGESVPVPKEEGNEVIGGSINGEGSLTVEVQKTGEEGYLSQVIDMVQEAQETKSKTQDLANRAAVWLTAIALGGGAITMFVWSVVMGADFAFALERTVTVMVITCPHALGLAVPLVVAVSTALSAQNGLLIRDRTAFEAARNLEAVIFDKTGTLTEGRFGVTDTISFNGMSEDDILTYAAAVESRSEHPIGKGIVDAVDDAPAVENFNSITGKGIEGRVNGRDVMVVSPGYLRENGYEMTDARYEELSGQGKTVVFVIIDEKLEGAVALADIIREESREAIRVLKDMGIQVMMLTGDNRQVAEWVAGELALDDYFAEVLPDEKADKVKEVQSRGLTTAMVGDGVNDAPALATADVGIAIGAGTDVAVETADIVLVRNNPQDVTSILKLAQSTYNKMVQNLWWAAGYNIFAIPVAAGVLYGWGILFGPAVGAALMSLSTVIVAINARLLTVER